MPDKTMDATETALQSAAKSEGVSVERVRHEMEIAVTAACQNGDPAFLSLWKAMLAKDIDSSSVESIVAYFEQTDMDSEDKV